MAKTEITSTINIDENKNKPAVMHVSYFHDQINK